MKRYWLTPPELEERIRCDLGDDYFDPCPYPLPEGWNALEIKWRTPWYLNPPFKVADGPGMTPFVRKAIAEGGPGEVIFSMRSDLMLMLWEAGARPVWMGNVAWLECETKERMPRPNSCVIWRLP